MFDIVSHGCMPTSTIETIVRLKVGQTLTVSHTRSIDLRTIVRRVDVWFPSSHGQYRRLRGCRGGSDRMQEEDYSRVVRVD